MLVGAASVGMIRHGRGPIMGVDRHFGFAATVRLSITAISIVVAVPTLLRVLMSLMALVSSLDQHFGEVGRKRDGHGRDQ